MNYPLHFCEIQVRQIDRINWTEDKMSRWSKRTESFPFIWFYSKGSPPYMDNPTSRRSLTNFSYPSILFGENFLSRVWNDLAMYIILDCILWYFFKHLLGIKVKDLPRKSQLMYQQEPLALMGASPKKLLNLSVRFPQYMRHRFHPLLHSSSVGVSKWRPYLERVCKPKTEFPDFIK